MSLRTSINKKYVAYENIKQLSDLHISIYEGHVKYKGFSQVDNQHVAIYEKHCLKWDMYGTMMWFHFYAKLVLNFNNLGIWWFHICINHN